MTIDTDTALKIISETQLAENTIKRVKEEWFPDDPPVTWVFATIGREISKRIDEVSIDDLFTLFINVELLLNEGSEYVMNAVATGLLEALADESSSGRIDIGRLDSFFGVSTKEYLMAWDKFTGV